MTLGRIVKKYILFWSLALLHDVTRVRTVGPGGDEGTAGTDINCGETLTSTTSSVTTSVSTSTVITEVIDSISGGISSGNCWRPGRGLVVNGGNTYEHIVITGMMSGGARRRISLMATNKGVLVKSGVFDRVIIVRQVNKKSAQGSSDIIVVVENNSGERVIIVSTMYDQILIAEQFIRGAIGGNGGVVIFGRTRSGIDLIGSRYDRLTITEEINTVSERVPNAGPHIQLIINGETDTNTNSGSNVVKEKFIITEELESTKATSGSGSGTSTTEKSTRTGTSTVTGGSTSSRKTGYKDNYATLQYLLGLGTGSLAWVGENRERHTSFRNRMLSSGINALSNWNLYPAFVRQVIGGANPSVLRFGGLNVGNTFPFAGFQPMSPDTWGMRWGGRDNERENEWGNDFQEGGNEGYERDEDE